MTEPLLAAVGLSVTLTTPTGSHRLLGEVDLDLSRGECVAIVGASGSGKSVLLSALAGIPPDGGRVAATDLRFDGTPILSLSEAALRDLRGVRVSLVAQEPSLALDPFYSVSAQLGDVVAAHPRGGRAPRERLLAALSSVGIVAPEHRLDANPSELSAGMKQRVLLAMALVNEPDLLLVDDPTTCVDAATQGHIVELLRQLREERGLSTVLATHDLALAGELADRVVVLHRGRVIEAGSASAVLTRPAHPQTEQLLDAARMPLGLPQSRSRRPRLPVDAESNACPLVPTCPRVQRGTADVDRCSGQEPALREVEQGHVARCHHAGEPP